MEFFSDMDDRSKIKNILKWAGIATLIALPVYLIIKKKKAEDGKTDSSDESKIYSDSE